MVAQTPSYSKPQKSNDHPRRSPKDLRRPDLRHAHGLQQLLHALHYHGLLPTSVADWRTDWMFGLGTDLFRIQENAPQRFQETSDGVGGSSANYVVLVEHDAALLWSSLR